MAQPTHLLARTGKGRGAPWARSAPQVAQGGGGGGDAFLETRTVQNDEGSTINQDFMLEPILVQFATTLQDLTPLNNFLADWASSIGLDPERYVLKPPPAPVMPPPGAPGPGGPGAPPPANGQANGQPKPHPQGAAA